MAHHRGRQDFPARPLEGPALPRLNFFSAVLALTFAVCGGPLAAQAPVAVPPPLTPPLLPPPPPPVVIVPPLAVAPPAARVPYVPFKALLPLALDDSNDAVGIAQQTARAKGLQARIMWIDGTANLNRVNTPEKVAALTTQLRTAGFNTIVFDIKPIVGLTLYPSKYTQKLTSWVGGRTLPLEFDPLAEMVKDAHANGLQIVTSMNVFSEGHRDFKLGPGYAHPEWQTTLYEPSLSIMSSISGATPFPLSDRANQPPRAPGLLTVDTDLTNQKAQPGAVAVVLDADLRVQAQIDGGVLPSISPNIPPGGSVLLGGAAAGDFLRRYAPIGAELSLLTNTAFVPISARPEQQVPLMTNPNSPEVQARILSMVSEVVRGYAVDGVIFDDRLRYAGINADFSPQTHAQFEKFLGHPVRWPEDVFTYQVIYPSLTKRIIPGPSYEAWNVFRTLTIRNWLASAAATVKAIRPAATVSVYAGSWYPDYPALGSNWAADDFSAGLRFLTPSYQQTGFAGLTDWITTGCYYPPGTIADAIAAGRSPGESVEAAGQFSNRAVNDQTWVYAGIALSNYNGHPELLQRALQAAVASTQGVMVFDLSHNVEQFWPAFSTAFSTPATAPHAVPGLLAEVRRQRAAQKAAGTLQPPVILYNGVSGTGL